MSGSGTSAPPGPDGSIPVELLPGTINKKQYLVSHQSASQNTAYLQHVICLCVAIIKPSSITLHIVRAII
jgi:RNA 3'-terminal phosphate cyclase